MGAGRENPAEGHRVAVDRISDCAWYASRRGTQLCGGQRRAVHRWVGLRHPAEGRAGLLHGQDPAGGVGNQVIFTFSTCRSERVGAGGGGGIGTSGHHRRLPQSISRHQAAVANSKGRVVLSNRAVCADGGDGKRFGQHAERPLCRGGREAISRLLDGLDDDVPCPRDGQHTVENRSGAPNHPIHHWLARGAGRGQVDGHPGVVGQAWEGLVEADGVFGHRHLKTARDRGGGGRAAIPGLLGLHRDHARPGDAQNIVRDRRGSVDHVTDRQVRRGGYGRQRNAQAIAVGSVWQFLVKEDGLENLGDIDRCYIGRRFVDAVPGLDRPQGNDATGRNVVQNAGAVGQNTGDLGRTVGSERQGHRQTGTGGGGHRDVAQLVQRNGLGQGLEDNALGALGDRVGVGGGSGVGTVGRYHHRVAPRQGGHVGGGRISRTFIRDGVRGPGGLGSQGNTGDRRRRGDGAGRPGQGQNLFPGERDVIQPQRRDLPGGVLPLAARRDVIQEEMKQRVRWVDVHQGRVESEIRLAVDVAHDLAVGRDRHDHVVILARREGGGPPALHRVHC